MPNDRAPSRSLAAANPAAARSSASSQDAGRSVPLSRTSGCVSLTCLLIKRTFPTGNCDFNHLTFGVSARSTSPRVDLGLGTCLLPGRCQYVSHYDGMTYSLPRAYSDGKEVAKQRRCCPRER